MGNPLGLLLDPSSCLKNDTKNLWVVFELRSGRFSFIDMHVYSILYNAEAANQPGTY